MSHDITPELRSVLNKIQDINSKEDIKNRGIKVNSRNKNVIPQSKATDVAIIVSKIIQENKGLRIDELATQVMEGGAKHPLWPYYEHNKDKILKKYFVQQTGLILGSLSVIEITLHRTTKKEVITETKMFIPSSSRNGMFGPSTGDTTWRLKTPELVTSIAEIKIKNMIQEYRTVDMRYRTDYSQEVGKYLDRIAKILKEIEEDVIPTLVIPKKKKADKRK